MKEAIKKEINSLLKSSQEKKPLFGHNRSHSMRATPRKFKINRQKFRVGSKVYHLPVKSFRTYWAKLKKGS